jgi:uncharacterized protein (TIGR00369 family)
LVAVTLNKLNMNNQNQALSLDVPFLNLLGVKLLKMQDGIGEISLTIEEKHTNSWSVAHGGVLLALVDAAMAVAARSADPDDRSVVTIELKNSFMQAANGQIHVIGKVVHQSTTMAFCEARVFDEGEKLCCLATGTFKYFKNLPTRVRKGQIPNN